MIHETEFIASNDDGDGSDDQVVAQLWWVVLMFVQHSLGLYLHFCPTSCKLGRRQLAGPQWVDPPWLGIY